MDTPANYDTPGCWAHGGCSAPTAGSGRPELLRTALPAALDAALHTRQLRKQPSTDDSITLQAVLLHARHSQFNWTLFDNCFQK